MEVEPTSVGADEPPLWTPVEVGEFEVEGVDPGFPGLQNMSGTPADRSVDVLLNRQSIVIEHTMAALQEGVARQVAKLAETGTLDRVDPTRLAATMLQAFPTPLPPNPMSEQIGPDFYDTDGVIAVLSSRREKPITKQAIESRRKNWTLVAVQTADNVWIYPTWQFSDGKVCPGITELIKLFKDQDRWAAADWITTPQGELGNSSAALWVLDGRPVDTPRELASHTIARWNQ